MIDTASPLKAQVLGERLNGHLGESDGAVACLGLPGREERLTARHGHHLSVDRHSPAQEVDAVDRQAQRLATVCAQEATNVHLFKFNAPVDGYAKAWEGTVTPDGTP